MYKPKTKNRSRKSRQPLRWIKRKIILILVAIMVGASNVIYEEEEMIFGDFGQTEQEQKKEL